MLNGARHSGKHNLYKIQSKYIKINLSTLHTHTHLYIYIYIYIY